MFKIGEIDLNQIEINELQKFMIIFKNQNDTRIQGKVKHLMSDIIMISFLAILARCDVFKLLNTNDIAKLLEKNI